jgi:hypothetical protein
MKMIALSICSVETLVIALLECILESHQSPEYSTARIGLDIPVTSDNLEPVIWCNGPAWRGFG